MKKVDSTSTRISKNISSPKTNATSLVGQRLSPPSYGLDFADHQVQPMQRMKSTSSDQAPPTSNNTGMPDQLKASVEQLSGQCMDDVKVHYNSPKPAQIDALAYAQGTDIHIGPGQEKHLPHEAWHVVQQKQGRVVSTTQIGGVHINDSAQLEKEADFFGMKARNKLHLRPPQYITETTDDDLFANRNNQPYLQFENASAKGPFSTIQLKPIQDGDKWRSDEIQGEWSTEEEVLVAEKAAETNASELSPGQVMQRDLAIRYKYYIKPLEELGNSLIQDEIIHMREGIDFTIVITRLQKVFEQVTEIRSKLQDETRAKISPQGLQFSEAQRKGHKSEWEILVHAIKKNFAEGDVLKRDLTMDDLVFLIQYMIHGATRTRPNLRQYAEDSFNAYPLKAKL